MPTATTIPKSRPSLKQTHEFPGCRCYQAAMQTGCASRQMAGGPPAATECGRLLSSVKNLCPQRKKKFPFLMAVTMKQARLMASPPGAARPLEGGMVSPLSLAGLGRRSGSQGLAWSSGLLSGCVMPRLPSDPRRPFVLAAAAQSSLWGGEEAWLPPSPTWRTWLEPQ